MNLTEKLLKPITETTYLTAENVKRYRTILRFFYLQYEKITYWMNQDEVYEEMKSHLEFNDYTMDQCKQDLKALVEWNNLMPMQDTKKVSSIEAFKNRQFRYQLTEYTVEIERMAVKLENLFAEGASLEPTLLERIRVELLKISSIYEEEPIKVYSWWSGLNSDFIRLNQNYQDYMRQLNSARAEELMKTKEFLIFKDKLTEYLRTFVKGLQFNTGMIEKYILEVQEEELLRIFSKVVEYESAIPRVDVQVTKKELAEKVSGRWTSLFHWFVSAEGKESEASRLFDMTNEIIRKMTRYAAQISEQLSGGANRKEEYRQLARTFSACDTTKEAHRLSSVVFGVEKPFHLKGAFRRETDSINSGVYEEEANVYPLSPRIQTYREKFKRSGIREHKEEKERIKRQTLEKMKREEVLLKGCIQMGCLDFKELSVISQEIRCVLLRWLSKALENKQGEAKTEDGRHYKLVNKDEKTTCILRCNDGDFVMPAFILEFEEVQE